MTHSTDRERDGVHVPASADVHPAPTSLLSYGFPPEGSVRAGVRVVTKGEGRFTCPQTGAEYEQAAGRLTEVES